MRIKWSEEKIARRIKEGFGSGTGKEYKPWIKVTEAGSEGTLIRPIGWKTKRVHQLLSQLEFHTFLAFEWYESVVDIREQYPLARNETEDIANNLSIKHSQYPGTDVSVVMTTDLLLTHKMEEDKVYYEAISVKPSEELEKYRTLEKLEIEKRFWENRNIKWSIVTEKDINRIFVQNMELIHNYKQLDNSYEIEYIDILSNRLIQGLPEHSGNFYSYFNSFEKTYNLESGAAITIFRYCLANKKLKINMFNKLEFHKDVSSYLI